MIFNTAQGTILKHLMYWPFSKKTDFIGILHNAKKIQKSIGQKIISRRIKKYFVLNDYILKELSNKPAGLKFESYYPIFFPPSNQVKLNKPQGEIWICIPGKVEFARRDYKGLFEAIQNHRPISKIKFIFLGKCDLDSEEDRFIQKNVGYLKVHEHVVVWNDFVDNQTFQAYLEQSDFILPLIHKNTGDFDMYIKYKITGAFNLAFAYQIPLLMEDSFRKIDDFEENAIFYQKNTMIATINQLFELNPSFKEQNYQHQKWTYQFQKDKYLAFLHAK